MRFGKDNQLIFSPSDLTNYMESPFGSYMDRLKLLGEPRATPDPPEESIQILQQRGIDHERNYLEYLKTTNANIREIPDGYETGIDLTLQAMQDGCDYIYQAQLSLHPFFGKCDFLKKCLKVPAPALGIEWSYEPCDTKLALKPKPYFGLCCKYKRELDFLSRFSKPLSLSTLQVSFPIENFCLNSAVGVTKGLFLDRIADKSSRKLNSAKSAWPRLRSEWNTKSCPCYLGSAELQFLPAVMCRANRSF